MKRNVLIIMTLSAMLSCFVGCNGNADDYIFDGNIVGTKWNAYYWDYDKTLVFETKSTGHILENRLRASPTLYAHFTYDFDSDSWTGKLTTTDEADFSEDGFSIAKNGASIQLKDMEWKLKHKP